MSTVTLDIGDAAELPALVERFHELGWDVVEMILAGQDSWDRYVAAQWLNIRRWLDDNPDDELADELRAELTTSPVRHTRYQREYLGWGVFVLMRLELALGAHYRGCTPSGTPSDISDTARGVHMRHKLALIAAGLLSVGVTTTTAVADVADVSGPCALPNTGVHLSEGPTNWANFVRPIGRVSVVTIFVDFPDAPATEPTTTDYANLMPGGAQWFTTSSYGRLTLEATPVHRWFRMPQPSTAYGFQRGLTFAAHRAYITDAVRAADAAVDFRGYQLLHIVPNQAAAAISFSPTFLAPAGRGVAADGREFRQAVTFGQDMWRWGFKVLNHESGHTFSLPDLYSFAGGHPFVGGWDLMGLISGPAPDYLAWHKWKLGWLDEPQLRCIPAPGTAQVTLSPLGTTGGVKAVIVRTGTTTAYVAEVRTRTGLDAAACDSGVLIYQVDSAITSGSGPVRVIDAHPATSVCGSGLGDAAFDLGTGEVSSYTNASAGVRFELLSRSADGGYTVRATRM